MFSSGIEKNEVAYVRLKLKLDFETTPYKILPVHSLIRFRFPKVTEEKYYHFLLCKKKQSPQKCKNALSKNPEKNDVIFHY